MATSKGKENKTKATDESVQAFLDQVEDERRREDSLALLTIMQEATGEKAQMWGAAIVGFGKYHYKYESGREGDAPLAGFSPRKQNLTLYLSSGFEEHDALLKRLGKHKMGKGCVYINHLADVDEAVLRELIQRATDDRRKNHPASE